MFTNFYGDTQKQYINCKELIDKTNNKSILLVCSVAITMYSFLMATTYFYRGFRGYRGIYIITLIFLFEFLLLRRYIKPIRERVALQIYMVITIIFVSGTMLSISLPHDNATLFPVLLVVLPLLFIDQAIRMVIFLLLYCEIYLYFVFKYKPIEVAYYDAVSTYMYLGLSMCSHYFVGVKVFRSIVSETRMAKKIVSYESLQGELKIRAEMDAMTGVYNRETFRELTNERIMSVHDESTKMVFGILDVDKFKYINDTYGHQLGDQVLQSIAYQLKGCLRDGDLIGRLGGDEFVFLIENVKDCEAVERIMNRIMNSIHGIKLIEKEQIRVSIGVTALYEGDKRFSELYSRADMALYKAKEQGRNCYSICR